MTMIKSITILSLLEGVSKEANVEDRALSIKMPWLELILSGKKDIEVRTWTTKYRGPVWLHAGKSVDKSQASRWDFKDLPTGAYLGQSNLADVIEFDAKSWESLRSRHLNEGDFQPGLYGWVFKDSKRIKPYPAPGKLGLYKLSPELVKSFSSS
jgi:activating signal cointegrator 1